MQIPKLKTPKQRKTKIENSIARALTINCLSKHTHNHSSMYFRFSANALTHMCIEYAISGGM